MQKEIIRLSELTEYHQVKEVYKNCLACFEMNNKLVNIDTIPPVFADIFSVILVQQGSATFSLNYREQTVGTGDLLLFWPSLLVSLTRQSPDFSALHLLCERTLFERFLASEPAYRQYSLFFCQTQRPILHLSEQQAQNLTESLQQITRHITQNSPYQEQMLHHLLHIVLLQVLELIANRTEAATLSHSEQVFQQFIPSSFHITNKNTTSNFTPANSPYRPLTSRASFARPPEKQPGTSSPACSMPKRAAC